MKTCWFLCVRPPGSLRAALQKYWTHPCLPRKVEGRPRGRPSLKGKLWIPGDKRDGPSPAGERCSVSEDIDIDRLNKFEWKTRLALPKASYENLCSFPCRILARHADSAPGRPLRPPRESAGQIHWGMKIDWFLVLNFKFVYFRPWTTIRGVGS